MAPPSVPATATDPSAGAGLLASSADLVAAGAIEEPLRWSLKWRLSFLLAGLFISLFALASLAYVVNARKAIGSEAHAVALLTEALLSNTPQVEGRPAVQLAALRGLAQARHLRVVAPAAAGLSLREDSDAAPAWFARLFREGSTGWSQRILVLDPGHPNFEAILQATPEDELSEKWADVVHAFLFLIVLLLVLNVGTWVIVSWQLHPLKTLRDALESVGSGERDVHVEPSAVEEVAAVQGGFNRMAAALREAAARNRRLTRELLRVQEEERRSIARELHDEFAQQLTAIDAEAAALGHVMRPLPQGQASVDSIRRGTQTLMRMVRGRLEQLRPEVLDEFGVIAAIEDLCESYRNAHPDLDVLADLPPELPIGDERSIALVRILQESLTNVVRHARATTVLIALEVLEGSGERVLRVSIQDNGVGLPAALAARRGFGLMGMRERAESLGGTFSTGAGLDGMGVAIEVWLPLAEAGL